MQISQGLAYTVTAPSTPGAQPMEHFFATLREARDMARSYADRKDLRWQDVSIHFRVAGAYRFLQYAGPTAPK